MENEIEAILSPPRHDLSILTSIFNTLLQQFNVKSDEIIDYFKFSLPTTNNIGNTFWSFVHCHCAKDNCVNFVVKRVGND